MSKQKAIGRRAVSELLRSGLEVIEIFINVGSRGDDITGYIEFAARNNIRCVKTGRIELDRMSGGQRHQGVLAFYYAPEMLSLDYVLTKNETRDNIAYIILDGVEDPRNFGAIIRSAEIFGVSGIITRKRRAASLTPAVVKASAGAALRFPIIQVSNVDHAARILKENGFWIFGLHTSAEETIYKADITGRSVFVMGAEGAGMSKLMKKRCDKLLKIPQTGRIESLNVSVSTGIVLYEWMRQLNLKSRILKKTD